MNKVGISAELLAKQINLEVLHKGVDFSDDVITIKDVNRPGLQLVGYYEYFDPARIQIVGKAEMMLLSELDHEERRKRIDDLMSYPIPALIIARGFEVFPEYFEMAEKYQRTLLRSQETTVDCSSRIIEFLNYMLAERITRHGVLMDIYGQGVLITGDSGIGKSETAIELIKRGHRLVSDDAVEIRQVGDSLMGRAPELIRNYMELRGIGVVDIRQLFGMGAVKEEAKLDLVIELEPWRDNALYDRLGTENKTVEFLDIKVPVVTIPVKPGRNIAVIVEVAAMNDRQKKFGYDAAAEFSKQVDAYYSKLEG